MLSNVCPYCENCIESIESHNKPDSEAFNCDNCNLVTSNKVCLELHKNIVHETALKIFACEVCNIDFSGKRFLFMHKDFAHNNKLSDFEVKAEPFDIKEEICEVDDFDEQFGSNDLLLIPTQVENTDCDLNFSNGSNLMKHKTKIDAVESRKYICDRCNKAFKIKRDLARHIDAVHLGIRNFKCNQCEKSFALGSGLKAHIEAVHMNIKKYKCDTCKNHLNQGEI